MPTFEFGDMWQAYPDSDLFLITTNSTLTKDSKLVMGAGIALEARERFPGLDRSLGSAIGSNHNYGLLWSPQWPQKKLGIFQVKDHWKDKASLSIINHAVAKLNNFLKNHPDIRVDLNFPGIGNGGLEPEEVMPSIMELPDNVHIWRYSV